MFKPRIAIFGASGFVGSALIERLFFDKGYDFVPFIHSFGNAARLARLPIELKPIDILDVNQVNKALAGCNVVVNCSRGSTAMMIKGLKNMIDSSRKNKVEKFIHIGSIAIYGENPPSRSKNETASPRPGDNKYGVMKLKQDEMVFKLHASGIPSMILCPSNISGPYSPFVMGAAQKLLSNEIMLVDDGKYPTNLIHVDNLVESILSAVESDKGWGERYFINEIEQTTWREFYEELKEILGIKTELRSISRESVINAMDKPLNGFRLSQILGIISSREFRNAMSKVPAFKKMEDFAADMFFRQKADIQDKIRRRLTGPVSIKKETDTLDITAPLMRVQVRQVFHSPEKIMSNLKYSPLLTYEQRRETTASWFKFINMAK